MPGARVELQAGRRGDFIVTCDGAQLWNKRKMGDEFPDDDAILEALARRGRADPR